MVSMSSHIVDALAVDAWCGARIVDICAGFIAALEVDVFDVEGVDVAGEVTCGFR
jgi:hypothetical protein